MGREALIIFCEIFATGFAKPQLHAAQAETRADWREA
jgi:hypothetical protein